MNGGVRGFFRLPTMSRGMCQILLWIVVGNIFFWRSTSMLLIPEMRVEDGRDIFAYFYAHPELSSLFRFKVGYMPLVPNLIGWFSTRFPPPVAAYLLAWIPFFLSIFVYGFFYGRRFSVVVPSGAHRFALCVLLALLPLGQFHLYIHTDYCIWNLLLLLIFLVMLRLPRRHLWRNLVAVNFLVWAHPLTIVIFPVMVAHFIRDRRMRPWYLVTLANLIVHQLGGVAPSQPAFAGGTVDLIRGCLHVTRDIFFRTAFGPDVYTWAMHATPLFLQVFFILMLPVTALPLLYRRTRTVWLQLLWYSAALLAAALYVRGYRFFGDLNSNPRYIYLQGLFLVFGWTGLQAMSPKWKGRLLAALIGWYGAMTIWSAPQYQTHHPENGIIVRQFLRNLWEIERRQGSREGIFLEVEKVEDWPIIVDTRKSGERGKR